MIAGTNLSDHNPSCLSLPFAPHPRMPEYVESSVSQKLAQLWSTDGKKNLLLKGVWADATKLEAKDEAVCPPGTPAQLGHVHRISESCPYYRGQASHQEKLYPQFYGPHVPMLERGLVLKGVHFAARNVVLDFGIMWAQVSG